MCLGLLAVSSPVQAQPLTITKVTPTARITDAPRQSAIVVRFNKAVDRSSITPLGSFWAFGRWSGTVAGDFSFSNDDKTVTLTPERPFSAGENVMVVLSHDIKAADGSSLRSAGYSWQFWTRARSADLEFQPLATLTTNISSESSRPYGGIGSDLDGDGWLDITLANEDTADMRVFMNKADGSGQFHAFRQPPTPVGNRASPSEPSDFNRDGKVDVAVANINDNTVSILLGNGDGTFAAQQLVNVGNAPRGVALLDVDGDGDIDIINTNADSGNLSMLINNGSGVFAAATFFGSGGELWPLAAADMNGDGILDLVSGARTEQQLIVQTGNGDGTFSTAGSRAAGGEVWMLVTGDVNGDGHEDVASVNSITNTGAIFMGDGNGQLGPAASHTTDPFPLATDLGDLDGDGDLDWITSSFDGDWFLFLNDGSGGFSFNRGITAPVAASCALLLDIDNDLDLDLGLVDEQADQLIIQSNGGVDPVPFQINPGLNGSWFNPATSGQGFFIDVLPNTPLVFLSWFTYDTSQPPDDATAVVGHPGHRWLTAQGPYADDQAELGITLTTGGLFDDPAAVENSSEGSITLRFQDCSNGSIEFTLDSSGLMNNIPITRISQDNVEFCNLLDDRLRGVSP